MAAEVEVDAPSRRPSLDVLDDRDARIEAMAGWFRENFADPADSLPYDSREGGYQWLWGGPFDAKDEIGIAFPDVESDEVAAAAESVEEDAGVTEWTVANWRLARTSGADVPTEASFGTRRAPPLTDRRAFSVVDTMLLPKVTWRWSVHATFIPGTTNLPLGAEMSVGEALDGQDADVPPEFRHFSSLRELIKALIDLELEGTPVGLHGELENSRDWVERLPSDSDIFVDDAIVVHASPAEWLSLAKLFGARALDAGSVTSIVVTAQSPGAAAGYLLAYGGARIFLRLVHGAEFLQDAFVERLGERIRRGDFDRGPPSRG